MHVWESIKCWAEAAPLKTSIGALSYSELKSAVEQAYLTLPDVKGKKIGLLAGNTPLWGIYDIALTLKGATVVPIPTFFSKEQVEHIISDSGIEMAVVDRYKHYVSTGVGEALDNTVIILVDCDLEAPGECKDGPCHIEDLSDREAVTKIIYTSGTTGRPKGVRVTLKGIEAVTKSLIKRTVTKMSDRHLSLLPLSTLVEAIGGLYVPLSAGSTIIYPKTVFPPENILFRPKGLTEIVRQTAPTSLNLVPSLLEAMLKDVESMQDLPSTLRFVACGGAPLTAALRERASQLKLPLYEGYGLSECSSVVALNGAGMSKPGSVGKILFHAALEIAADGEIIVSGPGIMDGYTGSSEGKKSEIATGDLGYIDDEGYLFITGRKDNLILTGQGRNVSPEWVESSLERSWAIHQVMVYKGKGGDISASIVPDKEWIKKVARDYSPGDSLAKILEDPAAITSMYEEVKAASADLPEYAKLSNIELAENAFSVENGFLGVDGRLNRKAISN
ncbi:MAG: AMP-binding protein [bacterium]|nr:AMP-binding protein [bacterium]